MNVLSVFGTLGGGRALALGTAPFNRLFRRAAASGFWIDDSCHGCFARVAFFSSMTYNEDVVKHA